MKSKIFVIGGSGMIGRELISQLRDKYKDTEVFNIDVKPDADCIVAHTYKQLFAFWELYKPDYVFNLSGRKGGIGTGHALAFDFMYDNIVPVLTYLRMCVEFHMPKRFLSTSSVAVYPDAEEFFEPNGATGLPHISDFYGGMAKRTVELACHALYEQRSDFDFVTVRPTNTFGIGDNTNPDTGMVVGATLGKLIRGDNPIVVWGDGSAERDILSASEVASGMIAVMENGTSTGAYNIGRGETISIKHLIETIIRIWNSINNDARVVSYDTTKPTGNKVRKMNNKKLMDLGWIPGDLEEELIGVVDYYSSKLNQ